MPSRRPAPRRREAPRWSAAEWVEADVLLQARAGGRCECCGELLRGACERHHRKRRRDGGDRLANLLVLLPACHAHWTAHPDEARRRGLIVPTYSSPELEPVLWRGSSWVLLTDWGELLPGE